MMLILNNKLQEVENIINKDFQIAKKVEEILLNDLGMRMLILDGKINMSLVKWKLHELF